MVLQAQAVARQAVTASAAARRQGDLESAVQHMIEAVRSEPNEPAWRHQLGVLHAQLGDWIAAMAAYEAAIALDPAHPAWYFRLGSAREHAWDLAGAREAYHQALGGMARGGQPTRAVERVRCALRSFHPFDGLIIAHRGCAGRGVENAIGGLATLPTYIGGVEIDVRVTRDGVPVLMHDRSIERTTDGSGAVVDLSYADLAKSSLANGESVPTLSDYLTACEGLRLRQIVIDVKSPENDALSAIVPQVWASPLAERCIVMVRTEEEMATFRELTDQLDLGCFGLRTENVAERIAAAVAYRASLLLVAHGDQNYLSNRDAVARAKSAGLRAGASTINSRPALEAARVDRCDLLLTDIAMQLPYFAGHRPQTSLPYAGGSACEGGAG